MNAPEFHFLGVGVGSNIICLIRQRARRIKGIVTLQKVGTVRAVTIALCFSSICFLASCGASPSSPTGTTGPQPDFSLSAQPGTVVIAPGGTQSAQVSVSGIYGFDGNVQVAATSPSGVTISPNIFTLSTSTSQQLTISASSGVSLASLTVSFTGTFGTLTHSAQLQMEVDLPVSSPHPPTRNRYLRTDVIYDPNELQYFPPHFTVYDSVHKRFFVSNPTLNSIDVFDSTAESQIGSIIVPAAWGIDITPDGNTMYAATVFGDVYLIDPVGMAVLQRFPSASLGTQGYPATQLFILANGQLVLFGGAAGLNVDGSQTFAIWNPTTNNLKVINADIFGQAAFVNIGAITLTADRTRVVVGSADSDDHLGLYDPGSGATVGGQASLGIVTQILPTPDGSRLFMEEDGQFEIFNAQTLAQLGTLTTSGFAGSTGAVLSYDGSTLFSADHLGNVTAYDTNSFSQTGWVPNFEVIDLQNYIVPSVSDETGLVVGPIGHGVAFLDTTQLEPGLAQTIFNIGFIAPGSGPLNGGTSVQAQVTEQNATSAENIDSGTIYIGNVAANNVSLSNKLASGLAPPASVGGPVDVAVVLSDGSIQLNPENFSYGPTIVELSTNAVSSEGGTQGVIFGYGLGQQPSDIAITVGGQPATVAQVLTTAPPPGLPYPFPMEAVLFNVPSGIAGSAVALTGTTATGSTTSALPLIYVPAVLQFTSPSAALMQGVYNPANGEIYFTDQSQIDVFSVSENSWLPSITISYANGSSRLMGIALSQDTNTLAVSDAGNANIYVLNPTSPNTVKSFHVVQSQLETGMQPYGLTVSNSGVVYYATFGGDAFSSFHNLDSTTGTITDYQLGGGSAIDRVLISPDGSYVYGSGPFVLNTATNSITEGYQAETDGNGNLDMAISKDGSTLVVMNLVTDANLNAQTGITYVDRDTWLVLAEYGQKLNADGSLIFQPLTTGIDELNASTGLLAYRVELPIQLANAYDALVIDNNDDLLFAITTNGIAEINLGSLPSPTAAKKERPSDVGALSTHQSMVSMIGTRQRRQGTFERPQLRHATQFLPLTPKKQVNTEGGPTR